MDWKDMLGQIRSDLPEGSSQPESGEEPQGEKSRKKDTLRVLVDRKGRKGKTATIVEGFTVPDEEVAEVAAMLKRKLGVGGSSRGGEVLVQGDVAERVRQILRDAGYKVK